MSSLVRPTRHVTSRPEPQVEVADPAVLFAARRVVAALVMRALRRVDLDHPGATAYRVLAAGGGPAVVDALSARFLGVALDAARSTAGLADPTVGTALVTLRARRHALDVAARTGAFPVCSALPTPRPRPVVGAAAVRLDGRRVTVPAGTVLDVSATTDALLAAAAARAVADRLRTGALVGVGGDVAQSGRAPTSGWTVPLPDDRSLRLPAGLAAATVRPRPDHPVVDPRTGAAVEDTWASVTVLHPHAVTAKALAVAAAVLADAAPDLLARHEVAFRLAGRGDVVRSAGWPAPVPGSRRYAVAS